MEVRQPEERVVRERRDAGAPAVDGGGARIDIVWGGPDKSG